MTETAPGARPTLLTCPCGDPVGSERPEDSGREPWDRSEPFDAVDGETLVDAVSRERILSAIEGFEPQRCEPDRTRSLFLTGLFVLGIGVALTVLTALSLYAVVADHLRGLGTSL